MISDHSATSELSRDMRELICQLWMTKGSKRASSTVEFAFGRGEGVSPLNSGLPGAEDGTAISRFEF